MLGPLVDASGYADERWKGAGQTGAVTGAISHVTVHGEQSKSTGTLGNVLWGKAVTWALEKNRR